MKYFRLLLGIILTLSVISAVPAATTVDAGADVTITLPTRTATMDVTTSASTLAWTSTNSDVSFTSTALGNTTVTVPPYPGTYALVLTGDGDTTDGVNIIVNPAPTFDGRLYMPGNGKGMTVARNRGTVIKGIVAGTAVFAPGAATRTFSVFGARPSTTKLVGLVPKDSLRTTSGTYVTGQVTTDTLTITRSANAATTATYDYVLFGL